MYIAKQGPDMAIRLTAGELTQPTETPRMLADSLFNYMFAYGGGAVALQIDMPGGMQEAYVHFGKRIMLHFGDTKTRCLSTPDCVAELIRHVAAAMDKKQGT